MTERVEKDSIGTVKIKEDQYYGVNAKRAAENFTLATSKTDLEFIRQIAHIKIAAATANEKVDSL